MFSTEEELYVRLALRSSGQFPALSSNNPTNPIGYPSLKALNLKATTKNKMKIAMMTTKQRAP